MRPTLNALLCALLPFIAVHMAYLANIVAGTVPACFPYIDGCLTISRAARSGEIIYVFRALMMPVSVLLIAYWLHCHAFIRLHAPRTGAGIVWMCGLGIVGAMFLVLYVTYLGTEGDIYRWMRRYGVIFYFSFTALAQIFFLQALYRLETFKSDPYFSRLLKLKLFLCLSQWGMGLLSIPLDFIFTDDKTQDIIHNVIEWNFAFAMNAYFLLSFFLFRRLGFRLRYEAKQTNAN